MSEAKLNVRELIEYIEGEKATMGGEAVDICNHVGCKGVRIYIETQSVTDARTGETKVISGDAEIEMKW